MGRKCNGRKIIWIEKRRIRCVITRAQFTCEGFYQITDDQNCVIPGTGMRGNIEKSVYSALKPRLFFQFPERRGFGIFIQLHKSARQTPKSGLWLYAPLNQKQPVGFIHHNQTIGRNRIFIKRFVALDAKPPFTALHVLPNKRFSAIRAKEFFPHVVSHRFLVYAPEADQLF